MLTKQKHLRVQPEAVDDLHQQLEEVCDETSSHEALEETYHALVNVAQQHIRKCCVGK